MLELKNRWPRETDVYFSFNLKDKNISFTFWQQVCICCFGFWQQWEQQVGLNELFKMNVWHSRRLKAPNGSELTGLHLCSNWSRVEGDGRRSGVFAFYSAEIVLWLWVFQSLCSKSGREVILPAYATLVTWFDFFFSFHSVWIFASLSLELKLKVKIRLRWLLDGPAWWGCDKGWHIYLSEQLQILI